MHATVLMSQGFKDFARDYQATNVLVDAADVVDAANAGADARGIIDADLCSERDSSAIPSVRLPVISP